MLLIQRHMNLSNLSSVDAYDSARKHNNNGVKEYTTLNTYFVHNLIVQILRK
jgi:hypothetical protein